MTKRAAAATHSPGVVRGPFRRVSHLDGHSPARLVVDELVARGEALSSLAVRVGVGLDELTAAVFPVSALSFDPVLAAAIEAAFDWPPGILLGADAAEEAIAHGG
ncbi:MAG TPA: hypothetical protein VHD87_12745 [Acidimicrobiales bacterium]|nr:hypothetical protein [Acidimicrobiales bacterium]